MSPFAIIEDRETPLVRSISAPWWYGTPFLLLASAAYVFFIGVSPLFRAVGLVVIISLAVSAMVLASRKRRIQRDALSELLSSLVIDLDNLRESLDKYLKRLDVRASRYFNSMTPSEASLRYFLAQISTALEHRVKKVNHFLQEPDQDNVAAAYQYLQVPLRIRESVVEREGRQKLIPLKDLRVVCSQYIQDIETVLTRIEKEFAEKDYDLVEYEDYTDEEDEDPQDPSGV